jgi:hypothetical protein
MVNKCKWEGQTRREINDEWLHLTNGLHHVAFTLVAAPVEPLSLIGAPTPAIRDTFLGDFLLNGSETGRAEVGLVFPEGGRGGVASVVA